MSNLLKAEWFKLRKDRSFLFLSLFLLAFAVLYPLTMQSGEGINGNDYYRGYVLSINNEIIRFFPTILAGFFIASEYSMGTMKSIVSSGNSRIRIYFAKLTLFSIGSIILLLILPIFMTGAIAIYKGFDMLPGWTFFLQSIGLISLYAAAFASIMALFSTILTDSGKAIGFLFLFLGLIGSLLEFIGTKISFLEPMITHSIFVSHGKLLSIDQIGHWGGNELFTYIVVPILTFLVFSVLGSFIFKKQEIK